MAQKEESLLVMGQSMGGADVGRVRSILQRPCWRRGQHAHETVLKDRKSNGASERAE